MRKERDEALRREQICRVELDKTREEVRALRLKLDRTPSYRGGKRRRY